MGDVGVRPAGGRDVAAVTEVQVRAWRIGYAGVVPTPALADMVGPQAREYWRERWAAAVTAPPSPRHRLLVAVERRAPGQDSVVGLTSHAPADEPDHDPAHATEVLAVLVDPEHGRAGHGSRLLAATAELARTDGVTTLIAWVFETDTALRGFLEPSGWAPDGARKVLDMGEPVPMIRLHTDLTAIG